MNLVNSPAPIQLENIQWSAPSPALLMKRPGFVSIMAGRELFKVCQIRRFPVTDPGLMETIAG